MATGQAIRAGRAFVELFADDTKLVRGLRSAQRRLRAFGVSVRAIGARMLAAGALLAGPLSLAVQAASDMEETMNKFNVVFGESAGAMKAWGDEFAGQIGRSKQQVADFLAGTQDLLVPIGFEPGAAREMSQQLTALAIDLASFNNMADADVLRDLHAALTGSSEVMKKYGVIVNETAVKQELFNQGIDPANATEQQKVLARLNIIMRGTTAAQGDAVRSAGSFANQMKALRAKVSDAAVEIGTALLPVVTPLVTRLARAVEIVATWIKHNSGLVVTIAKVAAAVVSAGLAFVVMGTVISGIGTTLGAVAAVITGIGSAIGLLGSILGALLSPIGLVVAGIVGLSAYLIYTSGAGGEALDWLGRRFAALKETALTAFGGISDALAAGDIGLAARILWLTLKMEWQKGVHALNGIWLRVKEFFLSVWTEAVFNAAAIATNAWAGLQTAWFETVDVLADAWTLFTTGLTKTWNTAVGFIRRAWVRLKSLFDSDIDVDAEVARINEQTAGENAAADAERNRRILDREQRRREQLAGIEGQRSGALSELDRMREAEHAARQRQHAADLQTSGNALAEARREWQQAIDEAARKREKSAGDEELAGLNQPGSPLDGLQQQLDSVRGGIDFGLTAAQKQAIQLQALGAGAQAPEEQTAKNTEQMIAELQEQNRTLRELLAQQRRAQPVRVATIG